MLLFNIYITSYISSYIIRIGNVTRLRHTHKYAYVVYEFHHMLQYTSTLSF